MKVSIGIRHRCITGTNHSEEAAIDMLYSSMYRFSPRTMGLEGRGGGRTVPMPLGAMDSREFAVSEKSSGSVRKGGIVRMSSLKSGLTWV